MYYTNKKKEILNIILKNMINNSHVLGWTKNNFIQSCEVLAANQAIIAKKLFNEKDILIYYIDSINFKLTNSENITSKISELTSITERILILTEHHLFFLNHNKELSKKIMAFLLLPNNWPLLTKILYSISDTIWKKLTDKSLDINYYTKRISLSTIYQASWIYMLQDSSPQHEDSKKFIKKSIQSAGKIGKIKKTVNEKIKNFIDINI